MGVLKLSYYENSSSSLKDYNSYLKVVSRNGSTISERKNYCVFGQLQPGRTFTPNGYRFGYNGKEMDNDAGNAVGAVYDYGFRIYDSRIAKFLSIDPLTKDYPWYTPYQFSGNKPIAFVDMDGLEEWYYRNAIGIWTMDPKVGGPYSEEMMSKFGYFTSAQAHNIDQKEAFDQKALIKRMEGISMVRAQEDFQNNQNPFYLIYNLFVADGVDATVSLNKGNYSEAAISGAFFFMGNLDAAFKGGKVSINYMGAELYTKSLDDVWKMNALIRGAVLESALAKTVYKGFKQTKWFTWAVDFIDDSGLAVSLKTVNAQGNFDFKNISKNIQDLQDLRKLGRLKGQDVKSVRLDIAVPEGYDTSVLNGVLDEAKKANIEVNIYTPKTN